MNQPSNEAMTLKVIAHIHTAFPTKFGIPRQSGLVDSLRGEIVFTPEYRSPDAVRGLEDFSHIWLVWQFSGAVRDSWSPTVRPPRLGGNTRMPTKEMGPAKAVTQADRTLDKRISSTRNRRMETPTLWA